MTKSIDSFQGEYRFLSNFHPARIIYRDIEYPTTEHAYQAAKPKNAPARLAIALASTPGKAKRMGSSRTLRLRPDWDDVKLTVMYDINILKYQIPELKRLLLATNNLYLMEGNSWGDTFWGVYNGNGENNLGKILMKIRGEIRND